jgi:hypothetical protein
VELAIVEGLDEMARGTLDAALGLVDPVWGGVYQYSHGGVWTNPHFEKIMSFQAEDMRVYALAYRVYGDERYLKAARDIERYLLAFLRSPEGAFWASQDADPSPGEHGGDYFALDDAGRRARGMPRVDASAYARENGWAITGLAHLFRATGDASTLEAAVKAAEWAIERRSLPGGGFRHDDQDAAGPYLADTLAMARAFFELHQVTQNRKWLDRSADAMRFLAKTFRCADGCLTSVTPPGAEGRPWAPFPQTDENIAVVRLALRLHHATGATEFRGLAEHAMKYLAGAARGANGIRAAGILLAARESAAAPATIVVVGKRDDPRTAGLLGAALAAPAGFAIVRLHAPGESADYPADPRGPSAWVCTGGACSPPAFDPAEVLRLAETPRLR